MMRLRQLPDIDGNFKIFEKSSREITFFILLIMALLILIACMPWSPKYEVHAIVETIPDIIKIESPGDGVIQELHLKNEQKIIQGAPLFRFVFIKGLLQVQEVQAHQANLRRQLNFLKLDIKTQAFKLNKLKMLWYKKVITFEAYQQELTELRRKKIQYQQTLAQSQQLQQEYVQNFKAPISGRIIDLNVQNQTVAKKSQLLFRIKPEIKDWRLKLTLPVIYKKDLVPGAEFRFDLPSTSKLRRYLIHAKLSSLASIVTNAKQFDSIEAYAEVVNKSNWQHQLMPQMNLSGYLLGPKHALIVWLVKMFFSI